MAEELVMPRLSDTMERGTVARWVKHEGDAVQPGDVVAEIETDKATMEYQSDLEGVLLRILVADGESAELGAPIALVGDPGEVTNEGAQAFRPPTQEPEPQQPDQAPAAADQPTSADASDPAHPEEEPSPERAGRPSRATIKASPIARRMADEAGIDLGELAGRGSGPEGRIVRHDVELLLDRRNQQPAAPRAAPAPVADAEPLGETAAPTRMQRVIAQRMTESKSTVPHFYLTVEVDMGRATEIRAELNDLLQPEGVKVSVNDLIIRACGLALVRERQFHRSWIENRLVYHAHANVGFAVALDDGLIVPVVRNVEDKPLRQVAAEAADLADRARSGGLKQPEIDGATFTVSNLGMFGIASFSAIINPPQPGILAVGATVDRPVVRDGAVTVRPVMEMTLSVDHRAASGADGARFLALVKRLLEAPLLLLG